MTEFDSAAAAAAFWLLPTCPYCTCFPHHLLKDRHVLTQILSVACCGLSACFAFVAIVVAAAAAVVVDRHCCAAVSNVSVSVIALTIAPWLSCRRICAHHPIGTCATAARDAPNIVPFPFFRHSDSLCGLTSRPHHSSHPHSQSVLCRASNEAERSTYTLACHTY